METIAAAGGLVVGSRMQRSKSVMPTGEDRVRRPMMSHIVRPSWCPCSGRYVATSQPLINPTGTCTHTHKGGGEVGDGVRGDIVL